MHNILKGVIFKWKNVIIDFFYDVHSQHQKGYQVIFEDDVEKIEEIMMNEKKINENYNQIVKNVLYDLAQYHFLGSHLRKIFSYISIATELERIADFVKNIINLKKKIDLNDAEKKLLFEFWKKLLNQFDDVKKLLFEKDNDKLLLFIKENTGIINLSNLKNSFDKIYQKKINEWSFTKFYFLKQFQDLDRCERHLMNIVEFLILINSFSLFKKIRVK